MLGLACQSSRALVSWASSAFLSCAPKSVSLLSILFYHSGVESPTHEIRADAAPSAHSAKSIIITLAKKHTFDRPVEILLHPSGMVSHVGFCCPSGRCLSQCKSWGHVGDGGGQEETRDLPSEKLYLFGRAKFLAPGVIFLGDFELLGCLRRSCEA